MEIRVHLQQCHSQSSMNQDRMFKPKTQKSSADLEVLQTSVMEDILR